MLTTLKCGQKKSIKYFEQHPVGLRSPILAWQTRYNFNSVPMATTVLCLTINPRNLKKIIGRNRIHLHMTRKGNFTDLHTQLYSLSLMLQSFLSLDVLLLVQLKYYLTVHCNVPPLRSSASECCSFTWHKVKYILLFFLLIKEIIKLPGILMNRKKCNRPFLCH